MKKITAFLVLVLMFALPAFSQEEPSGKVLILISEQNIEGPMVEWWLSEVDLSISEAIIAQNLIDSNYEVIDTSITENIVKKKPAFRKVDLSSQESVELGRKSKVDYVVLGKAVASAEGNVPDSNMISCHATITGKVIRVSDKKVIAYFDGRGSSAHLDVISGGSEALAKAANYVAIKIINALNR